MEQEEYENWFLDLAQNEQDFMSLLRSQQSKSKQYVTGLRAKLKHEREENVKLRFALRNKIVNEFTGAPEANKIMAPTQDQSSMLAITAAPHEDEVLLSESQALIEPHGDGGWEAACKEYEKLLSESYETRDELQKELNSIKNRNTDLERQMKAHKRSLKLVAGKRVQDRHAILEWKRKMETANSSPPLPSSDAGTTSDTREVINPAPLENLSDSQLNQECIRKRRKITDGTTEEITEPTAMTSPLEDSHNPYEPTQGQESVGLFVSTMQEEDQNVPYEFAKPKIMMSSLVHAPRITDTLAEKYESLDMEARGIPNLISSPVFSSSSPEPPNSRLELISKENEGDEIDLRKIKKEKLDEDDDDVQVVGTTTLTNREELIEAKLRATGFVVSDYSQVNPSVVPTNALKSSPPLVTAAVPSSGEATSSPVSSDTGNIAEHADEVNNSNRNAGFSLETPPKSVTRRSSSKYPTVDFADIDEELRIRQKSLDGGVMTNMAGDFESDSVQGSANRKRSKRKSVLIRVPTPQSVMSSGGPGIGLLNEPNNGGNGGGKGTNRRMDEWLELGSHHRGINTNIGNNALPPSTPTRSKNRESPTVSAGATATSAAGLFRAKKAALGQSVQELNNYEELFNFLSKEDWGVDDFLINPAYKGQAVGHAYKETVRGQRRQCDHGADCQQCSEFHTMAGPGKSFAGPAWSTIEPNEDGGDGCEPLPTTPDAFNKSTSNPGTTTTTSEVPATGSHRPPHTPGIITNDPAMMINKVSRHRAAWDRPKSPPGFWRSDFPNTQEALEEKRQAEERLKREARVRFLEAMKGGGGSNKYMFRDPVLRERVFDILNGQ